MQDKSVNFLELNITARAEALRQMAEIHKQDPIHEATTPEDFAEMIVQGYNPDKDFMFIQYAGDSPDKIIANLKDFS